MGNDEKVDGVNKAIEEFQSSVDIAFAQFASFVDDVISGRLTNIYTIEHRMDYMVGFGFDARIEGLYKKLCRFLYPKYPQMVVCHVKGYLETNREEDMEEEFVELHFTVEQELYDEVKRVDIVGGSHKNKQGDEVPTPHVHEKINNVKIVRTAKEDELPRKR